MSTELGTPLTAVLEAARLGDRQAIDRLFALLYPELREQAHQRLRGAGEGSALDTTSLVHESYLRFVQAGSLRLESRRHFLAYAAHVMRSVVVDFIRSAQAERRGGGAIHVTLNSALVGSPASSADEVIKLNEFLDELAQVDQRLVSIVEMKYFAALDNAEIAECLGITDRTVRRDLEKARLLLLDARS